MAFKKDFSPELPKLKEEERPLSVFNAAEIQNITLGNLWQDFYRFLDIGDMNRAKWKLDSIWVELYADALPKEEEKITELNNKIAKNSNNHSKFFQALFKKALFLKKLQSLQGKGTAFKKSEDDLV
jgi:muramidase (phage lysozyme)